MTIQDISEQLEVKILKYVHRTSAKAFQCCVHTEIDHVAGYIVTRIQAKIAAETVEPPVWKIYPKTWQDGFLNEFQWTHPKLMKWSVRIEQFLRKCFPKKFKKQFFTRIPQYESVMVGRGGLRPDVMIPKDWNDRWYFNPKQIQYSDLYPKL